MQETIKINEIEAWDHALRSWNHPSIPYVIAPKNAEEISKLGSIAPALQRELAFMKFPEFQTYMNLEKIVDIYYLILL